MLRPISALIAFLLAATPFMLPGNNAGNIPSHAQITTWSRSAQALPYVPNALLQTKQLPSPDGRSVITCSAMPAEQRVSLSVSEKVQQPVCEFVAGEKRMPIELAVGPEALWAPDSGALAVTHSHGGALGTYQVLIYRAENDRPVDITKTIRRDLAQHFPACAGADSGCTERERRAMRTNVSWVNVAAIRWIDDSSKLLMMAWVPDSTEFGANYGRLRGYVVDAHSGQILTRYSESEFKQKFKSDFGDWGL